MSSTDEGFSLYETERNKNKKKDKMLSIAFNTTNSPAPHWTKYTKRNWVNLPIKTKSSRSECKPYIQRIGEQCTGLI